jgi:signal transduction histidine kinase/putative methionine-R-sulfoxide reductase with GAF domain
MFSVCDRDPPRRRFPDVRRMRTPLLSLDDRAARREAEAALRRRTNELELLRRLHEAFREALDLSAIFQRVYDLLPQCLGVSRASLLLYDPAQRALVSDQFLGIRRRGEVLISGPQPTDHSISGRCFTEARPIVVPDCSRTDLIPAEHVERLRLRSTVAIPLIADRRVIGVLRLDDTERPGRFSEADVELFMMVGEQLAIIINSARLFTERKQAEQAQRFLAEASRALGSSLDYEIILEQVARLAVPQLADFCIVDIVEEDGRLRRVATAHARPEKEELLHELRRRYPPDAASPQPAGRVIRSGEPELHPEVPESVLTAHTCDPEHAALMRALGVRSYIAAPLLAGGRVLGAISLGAAESGRRYGERDLALATDLAGRAAMALDNARLHEELRKADQAKEQFMAMLAHELRNPLAAISNACYVLEERPDHPHPERLRDTIHRQARRLSRLVEDLLDVSRITRGKVRLRRERVDLREAVLGAVETIRPYVQARRHELSLSLPPEPLCLEADPARLEQVVANLLHNAANYTDPGGRIQLSLEVEGREGRGEGERLPSGPSPLSPPPSILSLSTATIRVRDSGAGIPPELLPGVFDLFTSPSGPWTAPTAALGSA